MNALTVLLALPLVAPSDDARSWSGFRGNNGTGVGLETHIPERLDKDANLAWRVEIPGGYSSPAIADGRLYLTAAHGTRLETMALDCTDGSTVWLRSLPFDGKRPGANSPAAPTPATDGKRVIALFHSFGLVAYDVEGNELWRHAMGPFNIPHGMASSPVLHGDTVVQLVDQDGGGYLVALDAATGAERWRTERPGVYHGYATPALYTPAGGEAQVIVAGSLQVAGYSLKTGEKLWWADVGAWQVKGVPVVVGDRCYVNSFMVTLSEAGLPKMSGTFEEALAEHDADGDGMIGKDEWQEPALQMAWFVIDLDDDGKLDRADWDYVQSAGRDTGGLYAIRLGGAGDVTATHVDWSSTEARGMTDAASPLILDGVLYMMKDGVFSALDAATGDVLERGRAGEGDQYFASPVGAAGRIVTTGLSGQLCVIRGGADWEVLSTTTLDEKLWSTPALADDRVYVRSQKALYCFEQAPEASTAEDGSAAEGSAAEVSGSDDEGGEE